ncbi:MAG: TolC family protein [Planctomycetota bacterium]|nr:TolC family protein [Planctomycetota bacterium]
MPTRRVLARLAGLALTLFSLLALWQCAPAQEVRQFMLPGQRHLDVRDPTELPRIPVPDLPAPPTVSESHEQDPVWKLSLDDAVRIALQNADVVRMVGGTTVVSSPYTIYAPAIKNTAIDQQRATFDPKLNNSNNTFSRTNLPSSDPSDPRGFVGNPVDGYRSTTGVSKTFIPGGRVSLDVTVDRSRTAANVLNPSTDSNLTLGIDQPLLKGAGSQANLAPILIARINTELSFFQMKDSVQDLVWGVIQTYWNLSFAQTQRWASQQQAEQGREEWEYRKARLESGMGDEGDVAQARVSYENFRAALIAAEANVLNQEALLRNLLGLPPSDPHRIVPGTAPSAARLPTKWDNLLNLAEQFRPDVVELKLILEADQQQLLLNRNQALPQLNLKGLYRWDGLEGVVPNGPYAGQYVASSPGQFTGWEAGVNFSVPLGLRKERAAIREQELLIMQDRVKLDQAVHSAAHLLAINYRNLSQYYEQYLAYRRVREAAEINIEKRLRDNAAGRRTLYVNVLLAITDWGNAVNSEYQALVQYNTELATLERQTGTILETHGVRFYEERYGSIGPLGRLFDNWCYPRDMRPTPNADSPPVAPQDQYQRPAAVRLPEVKDDGPAESLPPPNRESLPAPRNVQAR